MLRLSIVLLGLIFIFGQTYPTMAPPTTDCGSNPLCVYERDRANKLEDQKQKEEEQQQDYQQNILEMEHARLQEMQRQSDLMEEQIQESSYKDDKIEAQEEEIQSQQDEINNLRSVIDKYEEAESKRNTPRELPSQ